MSKTHTRRRKFGLDELLAAQRFTMWRKIARTVLLLTSVGWIAIGCTPALASSLYRAPDKRIFHRPIANNPPKSTIVVCSDHPTEYIGAARAFAAYAMADRPYVVIDGRNPPPDLTIKATTYVYFGHPVQRPQVDRCLRHYPGLMSLMIKKGERRPPPKKASDLIPGVNSDALVYTHAEAYMNDRNPDSTDNRIFICYDKNNFCERDLIPSLFTVRSPFCTESGFCDNLRP